MSSKRLKEFSIKVGFTELELKILFFIIVMFLIGLGAKYFYFVKNPINEVKIGSNFKINIPDTTAETKKRSESVDLHQKKVESESELSDFSTNNINANYKMQAAVESERINLNTAGIKELLMLPGIGEKIAGRIIEYRRKHGDFKRLSDLMKVKGIGKAKFEKIKKLVHL